MPHTAPPVLEIATAALAAQPFSAMLGTRLTAFGPDGATLELDVRDELCQQDGFVHGGVVAYLVDNAMAFAAGAVLGPGLVTGGFAVDYLRPATGELLSAHATVVRAGATVAVLRCDVHAAGRTGDPVACAVGQGRVTRLPQRLPLRH